MMEQLVHMKDINELIILQITPSAIKKKKKLENYQKYTNFFI